MGGKQYLTEMGISDSKIDVIQNSVDMKKIQEISTNVAHDKAIINHYLDYHSINSNNLLAFIGALDKTKNIDFLIEANRLSPEKYKIIVF